MRKPNDNNTDDKFVDLCKSINSTIIGNQINGDLSFDEIISLIDNILQNPTFTCFRMDKCNTRDDKMCNRYIITIHTTDGLVYDYIYNKEEVHINGN